jgi:hypothetical protein
MPNVRSMSAPCPLSPQYRSRSGHDGIDAQCHKPTSMYDVADWINAHCLSGDLFEETLYF